MNKNLILTLFSTNIPYVEELQPLAGSVGGCILMQQLDFWFHRFPKGFYKFMEPSGHSNYHPGDSWCEELGMTVEEFRTAFDRIGTRHKSKTQYERASDKFAGKFYASYLDRRTNLTYYFRNHEYLDRALRALATDKMPTEKPSSPVIDVPSSTSETTANKSRVAVEVETTLPAAVIRQSRSKGGKGRKDTGNVQQSDVATKESPDAESDKAALQETGKVHFVSTENTGSETTQILQQQHPSESIDPVPREPDCCGGPDLVFPNSLRLEERETIASLLRSCPEDYQQKVLDEVEGAIRANAIKKGVIPFCRSLVRAAESGTFTAGLGVSVLARRHADGAHVDRITKSKALKVEGDVIVKGREWWEQIQTKRKTCEPQRRQLAH